MSRRAVEAGFERFLDRTVTAIRREFSVGRALRGTGLGPGGFVLDLLRTNAVSLERRIVEPEFDAYRERSLEQFRVLLDSVESKEPFEAFEARLLAHDGYLLSLDSSVTPAQRSAVIDEILARLRRLGTGVEPILQRPEDEFWAATEKVYDRDEALSLVEQHFPFTGPLRSHPDSFAFEVRIDPNELVGASFVPEFPTAAIDYTDEAIRAMIRAERRVVEEMKGELRDRFQPGGVVDMP